MDFALRENYPIDNSSQVKTAIKYFDTNYRFFKEPKDRRIFAQNVEKKASELGVESSNLIKKYASDTYAPQCVAFLKIRRPYLQLEKQGSIDELIEKKEKLSPELFAEILTKFDMQNDLDRLWDAKIPDPWYSVVGLEKQADIIFKEGNEKLRVSSLLNLASNSSAMQKVFSKEFIQSFVKEPFTLFKKANEAQKLILARLANAL